MATKTINVGGHALEVRQPYAAGHVLTENEARTLNQTFLENVRNNTAGKLKSAETAWAKDAANAGKPFPGHTQETLDSLKAYADTYEFGAVAARSEPVDPIEKEAFKIAREAIRTALADNKKEDGTPAPIKVKDLPEGKFEEMVEAVAAQPDIVKEAKRRVTAKNAIGADFLAGLTGATSETAPAA